MIGIITKIKRPFRLCALVGFSLLLLSLAPAHSVVDGEGIRRRLAKVPVVKNIRDLKKQKAIQLGKGITVRLGIDATECPLWSSVFLYAYTEGFSEAMIKETNRDRLGPLWVSVHIDGKCFDANSKYQVLGEESGTPERPRHLLFVKPIPIDRIGNINVSMWFDKEVIGKVTIKGFADERNAFHAWSPFTWLGPDRVRHTSERQLNKPSLETMAYFGNGIALPYVRGDIGYSIVDDSAPHGLLALARTTEATYQHPVQDWRLPTMLRLVPDRRLNLSIDPKSLLVRLKAKQVRLRLERPDTRFLARWWVRGVPCVPARRPCPRWRSGEHIVEIGNELMFRVCFPTRCLAAKPGDTIDFQLLYCPGGWVPASQEVQLDLGGPAGFPILTNRVTFRLP